MPKKFRKEKATSLPPIIACYPTGSRWTCNPPVMNTDDDRLVLVEEFPCAEFMKEKEWELCMGKEKEEYPESEHWIAYRKGEKNLIFIKNNALYLQMVASTLLAKELNLTDKEDRVALFSAIQNGWHSNYTGPLPNTGLL